LFILFIYWLLKTCLHHLPWKVWQIYPLFIFNLCDCAEQVTVNNILMQSNSEKNLIDYLVEFRSYSGVKDSNSIKTWHFWSVIWNTYIIFFKAQNELESQSFCFWAKFKKSFYCQFISQLTFFNTHFFERQV
jgi:hypothetical protein